MSQRTRTTNPSPASPPMMMSPMLSLLRTAATGTLQHHKGAKMPGRAAAAEMNLRLVAPLW